MTAYNYMIIPGIKTNIELKLENLLNKCCNAFGVNKDNVIKDKRKSIEYIYALQLFCFEAQQQGYTINNISKVVHRSKASVSGNIKRVHDYLSDRKYNRFFYDVYENFISND